MVIRITQSALNQLKKHTMCGYISQIYVSSGGCSGIKWDITNIPTSKITENDELVNEYLVVEGNSIYHLLGSILDYKVSLKASEFIITNPNANHSCGCGKSFTTG
tara:strand:- start:6313 stop:6627 length:315 start_codon:yes stop_codon:yes gene_type:complete